MTRSLGILEPDGFRDLGLLLIDVLPLPVSAGPQSSAARWHPSRIAPSSLGSIRLSRPPTGCRSIAMRNNNCDPSTSGAIALAQITKAPAVAPPVFVAIRKSA